MTDFRRVKPIETGEEALASLEPYPVRQYVGFVFGAVGRRKLLAVTCFISVIGATVGLLAILPRSYHVETKILAQRQQAWPTLARSFMGEEPPTYAASEIIRRRDNLLSLIEKTHLMDSAQFPLVPNLFTSLIKKTHLDRWKLFVTPGPSREQKLNALVMLLDNRLSVGVGEGTMTISIDWPDRQMALQLVDAALRSFLEARRLSEISTIEEALAVLEARAESLRSEIETIETGKIEALKARATKDLAREKQSESRAAARFDPMVPRLKAMLAARRRKIAETEDFRHRRLAELQAQLAEKLAIYGESYPIVVTLKREIESFSKEPEQLTALRAEEQELEAAYTQRVGWPPSSDAKRLAEREEGDDLKNRYPTIKYQALLDRIESARIDLDTARSTFKYRYSIIWPPKLVAAANKPNVRSGLAVGIILALVTAALSATFADIRANRFVEPWQVEHELDLPIISEVRKL